jgi:hypothetical protein
MTNPSDGMTMVVVMHGMGFVRAAKHIVFVTIFEEGTPESFLDGARAANSAVSNLDPVHHHPNSTALGSVASRRTTMHISALRR